MSTFIPTGPDRPRPTPTELDPVEFPGYALDRYGNVLAKLHIEDLDEWHWLLGRLEDWLLHASEETAADYRGFVGPSGPELGNLVSVLGYIALYLGRVVAGAPAEGEER